MEEVPLHTGPEAGWQHNRSALPLEENVWRRQHGASTFNTPNTSVLNLPKMGIDSVSYKGLWGLKLSRTQSIQLKMLNKRLVCFPLPLFCLQCSSLVKFIFKVFKNIFTCIYFWWVIYPHNSKFKIQKVIQRKFPSNLSLSCLVLFSRANQYNQVLQYPSRSLSM